MKYKIIMSIVICITVGAVAGIVGILLSELVGGNKHFFMGGMAGAGSVASAVVINYTLFKKHSR